MFLSRKFAGAGGAAMLLAVIAGCASQGPLQPPSLNLPGLAQKLAAQRAGDTVSLEWTTPLTTTDGDKIRGKIVANVCLDESPGAVAEAPAKKSSKRGQKKPAAIQPSAMVPCHVVVHLDVNPGPGRAEVTLPGGLSSGPVRPVAFRIELLNGNGRSAGASEAVVVAAGTAPPAVGSLTTSGRREGAVVEWKAESTAAAMELTRTLEATVHGPVMAEAPGKAQEVAAPRAPKPGAPGAAKARQPSRVQVMRVEGVRDAGGTVDRTVTDGDTYRYVAQRVVTLTLAGQTWKLRGQASPPATFVYRDVFPPKTPTGLVSVPGGGFGEAVSVDLSWDANGEADVLGYNVYRSEGNGVFAKVNAEPVAAPAYRDQTAQAGHTYRYRVTAIDVRANESGPSPEVRESLRR